jgi:S1-C subfamily serine protease
LTRKLEQEGLRLFREGRVATNLFRQLSVAACQLTLVPAVAPALNPAALYRSAAASVVVIGELYHCGKCDLTHFGSASGFLISADGAVVTCRHVVERTNTLGLVAMTRDGRVWPVRAVLASNRAADLAILQLDGSGFTPLPLSTNAPVGTPVSVLSHPDGHYYFLTAGLVSRYSQEGRRNRAATWMSITAPFAKGSSGAPVLDAAGNVVGIVNNTESIYYDQTAKGQRDLQMVIHNCTPTAELLKLLRPPPVVPTHPKPAR